MILHVTDVNPTDYPLDSFVGSGLGDAEITVAFAHRKIKA